MWSPLLEGGSRGPAEVAGMFVQLIGHKGKKGGVWMSKQVARPHRFLFMIRPSMSVLLIARL